MKKVFLLFLLCSQFGFTQQIKQSLFTNGAAVSNNPDFIVSSNLGQLFIGLSLNPDFIVGSGFFYSATFVLSVEEEEGLPSEFKLEQNYPNPFNPATIIKFSVREREHVVIKIYDITGSEVATLLNQQMDAGNYSLTFDASSLASGVYIYRMNAGSFVSTKKMMFLK
jgi:hypothetical protein